MTATTLSRDAILDWLRAFATLIDENQDYLTQLDSAIGDADHGVNMHRGMQAVIGKLPGLADKDIGTILKTTGMTLVSTVGGASGPLYGTLFLQMGAATANKLELTLSDWTAALEAGINGVITRGKAEPGDKTMIDAFGPALSALKAANDNGTALSEALRQSAQTAEKGRDATTPLVARKGRASYLGERSAGHQDPGATSAHLLLKAAADTVEKLA
jgi:dihydroxyacetone kinase-like protein